MATAASVQRRKHISCDQSEYIVDICSSPLSHMMPDSPQLAY